MLRSQLTSYGANDPVWGLVALIGTERFTGEAVVGSEPRVHLYASDGRIYYAERDGDPAVGTRLVDAGALTASQLADGVVDIGGVASLARLFHRQPLVDRDAVELTIEQSTEALLEQVATLPVGQVEVFPLRHHSAGLHHWLRSVVAPSAGVPPVAAPAVAVVAPPAAPEPVEPEPVAVEPIAVEPAPEPEPVAVEPVTVEPEPEAEPTVVVAAEPEPEPIVLAPLTLAPLTVAPAAPELPPEPEAAAPEPEPTPEPTSQYEPMAPALTPLALEPLTTESAAEVFESPVFESPVFESPAVDVPAVDVPGAAEPLLARLAPLPDGTPPLSGIAEVDDLPPLSSVAYLPTAQPAGTTPHLAAGPSSAPMSAAEADSPFTPLPPADQAGLPKLANAPIGVDDLMASNSVMAANAAAAAAAATAPGQPHNLAAVEIWELVDHMLAEPSAATTSLATSDDDGRGRGRRRGRKG